MKVLIVASGGGHFAPALAVYKKLPKGTEVAFVGRKYAMEGDSAISLEYKTIHELGLPFYEIVTGRLQRKFTKHTIPSLLKIPNGLKESLKIIKAYNPDVVVSFGGYVGLPMAVAAKMLKLPVVLHEQTLGKGLSNNIASKFADTICISWPESASLFPKNKTILTGNPIAQYQMPNAKLQMSEDKPLLFITGGSLGSHAINLAIEQILPALLENYTVIHQTGDASEFKDYDRLTKLKEALQPKLQKRYEIKRFVTPGDFSSTLQTADLVIGRAGIATVSELLYYGVPALLIPLPHAQGKEQENNANMLVASGLGKLLSQDDITPNLLLETIHGMVKNKEMYIKAKEKARSLITDDAAERIAAVIVKTAKK